MDDLPNTMAINIYTHTCTDRQFAVPPRWIVEPSDVSVERNRQIALHCQAQGVPTPVIVWKKTTGERIRMNQMKQSIYTYKYVYREKVWHPCQIEFLRIYFAFKHTHTLKCKPNRTQTDLMVVQGLNVRALIRHKAPLSLSLVIFLHFFFLLL